MNQLTYSISDIAKIIRSNNRPGIDFAIEYLVIDSRKIVYPEASLFFALNSTRRDGHSFIPELLKKGVRNFVVAKGYDHAEFQEANFLEVDNVLDALQALAAHHRSLFLKLQDGAVFPVIGITGSNGKTIVKEWLYQLLAADYRIVRSPRSYNSQIGVALSVWQISTTHNLGIFEAGISTVNEMERLEKMIQPTIGIFTGIGEAHREGFSSAAEKFREKIKLFENTEKLVVAADSLLPADLALLQQKFPDVFFWSRGYEAPFKIIEEKQEQHQTKIAALINGKKCNILIPFADKISVDNVLTCCSVLLLLGYELPVIQERIGLLESVEMRMQLKKANNNCYLINDSYSNDLSSLTLALTYLTQQAGDHTTTLILSDILEAGISDESLYEQVAKELEQRNIRRLIGIGKKISEFRDLFVQCIPTCSFFDSTEMFLQEATTHLFQNEYILLKGARVFEFERISKWLEQQQHQTVMEINLSAMAHNLKAYQQNLLPSTKVMAMVKAFSYGSGSVEIARLLEFHKIDYLAVAYADEGVVLRKAGIRLPIMVMSADAADFDALLEYHLEPEIYSFHIFHAFQQYLQKQAVQGFPIHVKFNTGMNRLGLEVGDASTIAEQILNSQSMVVKSVFSHLAASESAAFDQFTKEQAVVFDTACAALEEGLGYRFIRHLSNTAAIFRNPALQYDMVRLGIGLYGVDTTNEQNLQLQTVATLKSTIAQIREVQAGDTIGYGRMGLVTRKSKIATVRIGYADGFNRRLGNGNASMLIKGQRAPVIGNVCMDMTMLDITDLHGIEEGDTVEIFGTQLPVQEIAKCADTIPYEIMTGISQRVKRVYLEE